MSDELIESNRSVVIDFWAALYDRDWDRIASFFVDESVYTDMPTPADDMARGPEQILKRLRLGIEPITDYEHRPHAMVAEGNLVITEHEEVWRWHTGEEAVLPFVSVHELRDGKIVRWYDYWDLQTLLGNAPQWWIDHIMQGYV
ncbi:MAG: nuclear transport factor 2 family protein [Actinobacteria bacterium]|nr:nuclear transport factor 2 family protein [Actinomycetota bacterium]